MVVLVDNNSAAADNLWQVMHAVDPIWRSTWTLEKRKDVRFWPSSGHGRHVAHHKGLRQLRKPADEMSHGASFHQHNLSYLPSFSARIKPSCIQNSLHILVESHRPTDHHPGSGKLREVQPLGDGCPGVSGLAC